MNLKELADMLGAELTGPADVDISGAAGVLEAREGQITFITGKSHLKDLERSQASAALVPLDTPALHLPLLRLNNPRLAFARTLEMFYVKPYQASGISEKAAIGANVVIGADPSIHPFVVLADDVKVGERVTLYPGVSIGRGSVVDDDSVIHANVSIGHNIRIGKRVIIHAGTVLGSDGFGFVTDKGRHHKIPQVGGVIIEDDVEIGGNCTIDRATLGNTLIKKGTKLDNQVHVAHNVTIGENCLIAGQVGIAGSSTIGNSVMFGGQVGVADHITVGDQVMAGGGSGITRDVEAGQVIAGYYAMPIRDWLKVQSLLPKLPELIKRIRELEKLIKEQ
ncbi:MAG: UDP-3-O-(3-hydroxymyristoyl)glucosamine N-acyltransferase [Nitrospirae bacterium]|nr:UDP-3-O-(3-hydroxymyristoyl)glucosamine N-acyltransferase [Nitrospirota bacterium]